MLQAPSFFVQDHGVIARRNQLGTFQVKNELKTETSTKFPKTKTTQTEQKTMVVDKVPTAGQRAVHLRALAYALAIIGAAAACGVSVCPRPSRSTHALRLCTPLCVVPHSRLCLWYSSLAVPRRIAPT